MKAGTTNYFTDKELIFLRDKQFLLTKHIIIDKIYSLFTEVEKALSYNIQRKKFNFPKGTFTRSGKISKGESYQKLPYLMLDYPRLFSRQTVFAYRTMFWWGNFFSCTLHLQGNGLEPYRDTLLQNIEKLKGRQLHVCIHDSPWEYYYGHGNYAFIDTMPIIQLEEIITNKVFIKLSRKIKLTNLEKLPKIAGSTFTRLLTCLQTPHPQ